jgi:hypothetical protein
MLITILPSIAQDTTTHRVSFNNYSFIYPDTLAENIRITTHAADPLDQPLLSQAGHQPKYAEFELYNEDNYRPELRMRFFQTADLVGYREEDTLANLQALLAEHPELKPLEQDSTAGNVKRLPAHPHSGAAQILTARAEYIETETFVGIRYLAVYGQDMYPINRDSFRYTFLGVSKDGSTYVMVETTLTTDLFPDPSTISSSDLDAFYPDPHPNYQQATETVDAAPANAFTPNLDDMDALVATIQINAANE